MEQSLQNVPSDNADYEDIWINVPYIETDSDTLKDISSNTIQNQSLHTLPDIPLNGSVLENISNPQNQQSSDCSAGSDLKSALDCTFEYS